MFPEFVHQIREDMRWALYRGKSLSKSEKKQLEMYIKQHFSCMVANIIEILSLDYMTDEKFNSNVRIIGEENLRNALSKGKGAILLMAHFGNWEYIGYWLSRIGNVDIASFYLDQYSKTLDAFLNKRRLNYGIKLIHREEMKAAIKHLKSNGILALISDQDGLSTGEYIYFFDRLVSAPKGVVRFAHKFKCPVIPVYSYRNMTNFSHNIVFGSNLSLVGRDVTIQQEIKKHYSFFEDIILNHPQEWLWAYKRWKSRRHVVRTAYNQNLPYYKNK